MEFITAKVVHTHSVRLTFFFLLINRIVSKVVKCPVYSVAVEVVATAIVLSWEEVGASKGNRCNVQTNAGV